jgi:hypothetical protein
VRAIAKRNGYGVRQEGDETFGLIGPEIDPNAAIEHELNALLTPKVSLKERHGPAVDHDGVRCDRTGEGHAELVWQFAVVSLRFHRASFGVVDLVSFSRQPAERLSGTDAPPRDGGSPLQC